jgi:16S rRNA G966 N2-methylase RsmD
VRPLNKTVYMKKKSEPVLIASNQNIQGPRATTGKWEIHCAYDELLSVNYLAERVNPENPNKHPAEQIKLLRKIYDKNGIRSPITISTRSGKITKGHGRLLAAQLDEPLPAFPVNYQHYASEALEWADILADNKIAELAEVDETNLKDILSRLDTGELDLDLTGFNDTEIESLMTAAPSGHGTKDAPPKFEQAKELNKKWGVAPGQIWELGRHRLACGDCRDMSLIRALMDGNTVEAVFTDPPYNSAKNYGPATKDKVSEAKYKSFCQAWFYVATTFCSRVVFTPGPKNIWLWSGISKPRWLCVWVKKNQQAKSGRGGCNLWEPVLVYGKEPPAVDVWEILVEHAENKELAHPVPKSLPPWQKILHDTARKAGNILDMFAGSGTTILACENLGKTCFAVETSPEFCAVILERFLDATGIEPTQESND